MLKFDAVIQRTGIDELRSMKNCIAACDKILIERRRQRFEVGILRNRVRTTTDCELK